MAASNACRILQEACAGQAVFACMQNCKYQHYTVIWQICICQCWSAVLSLFTTALIPTVCIACKENDASWLPLLPHGCRLIKGGMSFTNFYSAPLCAMGRAEFLTGRSWTRTGNLFNA
jgi:hypothetical protein